MFRKIMSDSDLFPLFRSYCSENRIEVCLSEGLEENSDDKLLILKVDAYYSSANGMHNPPASVDCLILVKCDTNDCYDVYIVELRDINSPNGFDKKNIVEKFTTTINDFLGKRFKTIFYDEDYCFHNFKCYFVTDPYGCSGMTQEEYDEHIHAKELKLGYFNSLKPFVFRDKIAMIEPILPNPMIAEC